MNHIDLIGIIAGACTSVSFIPQAYKTIRTRNTSGISLYMCLFLNTGVALWLIYGIYASQIPVILANALTLPFSLIILYFKILSLREGA